MLWDSAIVAGPEIMTYGVGSLKSPYLLTPYSN